MRVIQVKDSLYQFVPDIDKVETRVHRYEKVDSPKSMNITTLEPLNFIPVGFALVCIDEKTIILIDHKKDCHVFNTVRGSWDTVKLPRLNTSRRCHSAVAINNLVCAVCGFDNSNKRFLNSIEVLGVRVNSSGGVSWVSKVFKSIDIKDFTPR